MSNIELQQSHTTGSSKDLIPKYLALDCTRRDVLKGMGALYTFVSGYDTAMNILNGESIFSRDIFLQTSDTTPKEKPDLETLKILIPLLENVPENDSVYNASDDLGGLDTLQVTQGMGTYVGVSHTYVSHLNMFISRLSTSQDLVNWERKKGMVLGRRATNPRIAWEKNEAILALEQNQTLFNSSWEIGTRIVLKHFNNQSELFRGKADMGIMLPRRNRLLTMNNGTPNIVKMSFTDPEKPSFKSSVLTIRGHEGNMITGDLEIIGQVTNFDPDSWSGELDTHVNNIFRQHNIEGKIGDRVSFVLNGHHYLLIEAQTVMDDFSTWRPYLYDENSDLLILLGIKTKFGSKAFSNPTITFLKLPPKEGEIEGENGIVVTFMVNKEAAAISPDTGKSEEGTLIYFKKLPLQLSGGSNF